MGVFPAVATSGSVRESHVCADETGEQNTPLSACADGMQTFALVFVGESENRCRQLKGAVGLSPIEIPIRRSGLEHLRADSLRGTLGEDSLVTMVAPAIQLFPDDARTGLVGARFPVELRADEIDPSRPSTWPALEGRLEYIGGRLLYMPPCADYQQDVAIDVAYLLRSWSERHQEFVVGGNEAGMKLGDDLRAADVAVWRAADAVPRRGRVRSVPPILAVEIGGQDEEESVLRNKARWYLDHGVALVWLVLPATREVIVIDASGEQRYGGGQRLSPNGALPDLEPEVSRFFAQLDR